MSNSYRVSRERWAAKKMVLTRWLVQPRQRVAFGQPICELEADGRRRILTNQDDEQLTWGIYWHYVDEGDEISPDAAIFEYSYDGRVPAGPQTYDPRDRVLAYQRRESYPDVFLSYRRADGDAFAGRLHEFLSTALGSADAVFMDQFSIRPREPFPWALPAGRCARQSDGGPRWLRVVWNDDGRRRKASKKQANR